MRKWIVLVLLIVLAGCAEETKLESKQEEESTESGTSAEGGSSESDGGAGNTSSTNPLLVYNFDDGLAPEGFNSVGDASWFVDEYRSYSPTYSAGSGIIADSQISCLVLETGVPTSAISFFFNVSTEPEYDGLVFIIGDEILDGWSGEWDWTDKTYEHVSGLTSYSWCFTKNESLSAGVDAAWVDEIKLYE